jgi:hypothetical protein
MAYLVSKSSKSLVLCRLELIWSAYEARIPRKPCAAAFEVIYHARAGKNIGRGRATQ